MIVWSISCTGPNFFVSTPSGRDEWRFNKIQLSHSYVTVGGFQLKCDGTLWRTGGEVKEKLANGVSVSNITTADAHNSAASSRLNWRPP